MQTSYSTIFNEALVTCAIADRNGDMISVQSFVRRKLENATHG